MNAQMLVFVICAEAIMSLLLYNLPDCNFKCRWQNFSESKFIHKLPFLTFNFFISGYFSKNFGTSIQKI